MTADIEVLERTNASLSELIEAAAAEVEAQRQAEAVASAEATTDAHGFACAYNQGRRDERARVLALLVYQRETLRRPGSSALAALRRALEVEP